MNSRALSIKVTVTIQKRKKSPGNFSVFQRLEEEQTLKTSYCESPDMVLPSRQLHQHPYLTARKVTLELIVLNDM